jgi:Na+/phosphate symporter
MGPTGRRVDRRARLIIAWALTGLLVGGYVLASFKDDVASTDVPDFTEPCNKKGDLEILTLTPGEPTAGRTVEIRYNCLNKKNPARVRALLSVPMRGTTRSSDLEVLYRRNDKIVVRIPRDAPEARHKLRVQQGEDQDKRSKPYDLHIQSVNRGGLYGSILGGLALLFFGLRTLSSGSCAYAGQRQHGLLLWIARQRGVAVGVGVLLGGLAQFTTTAVGLVVGLIESNLLALGPAAAIVIGAQLGSAAMPWLIGVTEGPQGLVVITIGVLWLLLAPDRRSSALGKIILGCGLLLYAFNLLRLGFAPLVADPEILPYIALFQSGSFAGLAMCVGAGVLLAAALQGPGPVYVLVLSLAQASDRVDLQSALAILAGTFVGAAICTVVVSWPFGREARRLAVVHCVMAVGATVVLAATVDVWAYVADALVSGEPNAAVYGKKVLLPNMGSHLAAGFMLSQVAVALALVAVLPVALKGIRADGMSKSRAGRAPTLQGEEGLKALRAGLVRVLSLHREALLAIVDLCLSGDRSRGVRCEHVLGDARAELEVLFGGSVRHKSENPEFIRMQVAALAIVQLQRAVEDLLSHAERTTERATALTPAGEIWHLPPESTSRITALHTLLLQGVDGIRSDLSAGTVSDIDTARAREIRVNALEREARQALLVDSDHAEDPRGIALRLNHTDLVNAYETVGNHLYRLSEAVVAEAEQDATG